MDNISFLFLQKSKIVNHHSEFNFKIYRKTNTYFIKFLIQNFIKNIL